ncbi:MAG: threonylcarbamoyl-AMP synthase [Paludibacteraceae bacterium]|nr:threonylcarbamoyl-AMP synthase [Paludibacteraceae bacterium]
MIVRIYSDNPNKREISQIADILRGGGVVIYPTDTLYAFACDINNADAVKRIAKIKGLDPETALFSIVCGSISQISTFTTINNVTYKMLKGCLPGPFTFIFKGGKELPGILKKRKQVGVRIPDNSIAQAIVAEMGRPIISSSIPINEDEVEYCTNPELIEECYQGVVDCVIDGGIGGTEPSTIIDCTGDEPVEKRKGKGILID